MTYEPRDQVVSDWLAEGPERGSSEALSRALAATRRVSQRPRWSIAETWMPRLVTSRWAAMPRRTGLVFVLLVLALIVALLAATIGSRPRLPAPFGPARNGLIAFDAGGRAYVARADGSDRRAIAGGLRVDVSPTFSPDGTEIAFFSSTAVNAVRQLIVTRADGSGTPIVVGGAVSNIAEYLDGSSYSRDGSSWSPDSPSWSPDGTRLAFFSSDGGVSRIYVAQANGGGVTPITDRTADREFPVWSPDGQLIAYQIQIASRLGQGLAVSRPDGTGERILAWSPYLMGSAFAGVRWFPDATRLAYFRFDDEGESLVATVNLAGQESRLWLGYGRSNPVRSPDGISMSPDGTSIAFLTAAEGLIVVDAAGRNPRILGHIADCYVSWSPDGTEVIGNTPGGCTGLVTIPVASPGATRTLTLPGDVVGIPSWQRLAP